MEDKPIAFVVGVVIMAGCCIGVPLLIGVLGGVGLFAWLSGNTVLVIAAIPLAAAGVLFARDRKRRRRFHQGEGAVRASGSADDVPRHLPPG